MKFEYGDLVRLKPGIESSAGIEFGRMSLIVVNNGIDEGFTSVAVAPIAPLHLSTPYPDQNLQYKRNDVVDGKHYVDWVWAYVDDLEKIS